MGASCKTAGRVTLRHTISAILVVAALTAASPRPAKAAGFCDPCTSAFVAAETELFYPFLGWSAIYLSDLALDPVWGVPSIINALYGTSVVPLYPGVDADMNMGFKQINTDLGLMAGQVFPTVAQMGSDKTKTYGDVQGQAKKSTEAIVSEKSSNCAFTYGKQLRAGMEGFVTSLTRGAEQMVRNRDTGVTGQVSVGQLECEVAPFLSNQPFGGGSDRTPRLTQATADAAANCPLSDANGSSVLPTYLIDGYRDQNNVFGAAKLQFSLPDNIAPPQPNGHIRFHPQNDSEWEFVAAWRFCEGVVPKKTQVAPTGSSSGTFTTHDIDEIIGEDDVTAVSVPMINACMHAIAYRTACSSGTGPDFVGVNPGNCWQIQDLACHRLTNSAPSGLGITATGDADVDYALANCDDDGLSLAMFDRALALACGDANYTMVTQASEHGTASKSLEDQGICDLAAERSERGLNNDLNDFVDALSMASVKHVAK